VNDCCPVHSIFVLNTPVLGGQQYIRRICPAGMLQIHCFNRERIDFMYIQETGIRCRFGLTREVVPPSSSAYKKLPVSVFWGWMHNSFGKETYCEYLQSVYLISAGLFGNRAHGQVLSVLQLDVLRLAVRGNANSPFFKFIIPDVIFLIKKLIYFIR